MFHMFYLNYSGTDSLNIADILLNNKQTNKYGASFIYTKYKFNFDVYYFHWPLRFNMTGYWSVNLQWRA